MMLHPAAGLVQVLVTGLVMTALSGCSSPSTNTAGAADASASSSARAMGRNLEDRLRKGMTREQVRAAIGSPDKTRPGDVPADAAEVWLYRRTKDVVRQAVVATQDIPYVDPFTGQTRMVPEPVYEMETTTIVQVLRLYWENGALARWKSEISDARSYFK